MPDQRTTTPELEALRRRETRVFGIAHQSLAALLDTVARVELHLAPPISVRLHGDFNTNNIVYDSAHDRVHYIDVHRSGLGDYVQDVGVLLVSNLRIPIQDARLRADLERVNGYIRDFAAEFARLVGDVHFDARLTVAEARSFITSSRLVADTDFARDIFLQGVRLLEQAASAAA